MFSKIFNNGISKKGFYFAILFSLILWFFIKNTDVAIMFFIAILFACSLSPLVDKLNKKMNRSMSTILVLLGVFLVTAVFVVPILLLCLYEIGEFAVAFPNYIEHLDSTIKSLPFLKGLPIPTINTELVVSSLVNSSENIFDNIVIFTKNLSSGFLYIFTAVIFLYFFLVDEKSIKENVLKLFPIKMREKTGELIDNISNKLGGYVMAQVLVSGSVWITMTIGLALCNIQYALVLGLIAGVMSIIPVVGSAISLVICLIATYEFGLKTMIIVTVLFTISHFVENHVVRPYIYSKFLNLHPIIIFLALFVGAKYAGVLGILLASPIAMALYILIDELYIRKMEEK